MYFWFVRKPASQSNIRISILLVILWVAFAGCTKRYWFRVKVPGKEKDFHTVKVHLINVTPGYLSPLFVTRFEEKVYQSLYKFGFIKSARDTAEYNFTITMCVEAASVKGISRFGTGNSSVENESPVSNYREPTYSTHWYQRSVTNINFKYSLEIQETQMVLWTRDDYVYFKQKDIKDINRSVSVLKLALRKKGEE